MDSLLSLYRPYTGNLKEVIADIYPVEVALRDTLVAAACFCLLTFCTDRLVPLLFPDYHKALPEKKKNELAAYVSSTVHHSYVVPYGLYLIYFDVSNEDTAYDYKADMTRFIPFVGGYLLSDMLFFALPHALKGNFETIGHHIVVSLSTYDAPDARHEGQD
jgi:hypothetical protein